MGDTAISVGGNISQSVLVTGDYNYVSLRFGADGPTLPLDRRQFPLPSGYPEDGEVRVLELFRPDPSTLPFVGRADILPGLLAWLHDPHPVSVYAITAQAGTGKTRLAIELCSRVDPHPGGDGPWRAGFVSPHHVAEIERTLATHPIVLEHHTLVVLDYAGTCHATLAQWLNCLVRRNAPQRLRILLLERQAPEAFGWWHELREPRGETERLRRKLFAQKRPLALPDLTDMDERRDLLRAALAGAARLRGVVPPVPLPEAGQNASFDRTLATAQFGNPLALVMAGLIALDGDPGRALGLRRLDAARHLARNELARMERLAEARGIGARAIRHMVAFNGMAGGLAKEGLQSCVRAELAESHQQADVGALADLLYQEFPLPSDRPGDAARALHLGTIQPDLIGEGAIIEAFAGSQSLADQAVPALQRAYNTVQEQTAASLFRLLQDYAYAIEDEGASEEEKETGERVMGWLVGLAAATADPTLLEPLVSTLPHRTLVLREVAVELTERLATFYRQRAQQKPIAGYVYEAARWAGDLALRQVAAGCRGRR